MPELFVALLTAHLLGEFVFQTDWRRQNRIRGLLLPAAIVTLASYLLLGIFHWQILLAVFLAHCIVDTIKRFYPSDALLPFLTEQCAHIILLAVLSYRFSALAITSWWMTASDPNLSKFYFASLSVVSGLILCIPVGGILIAKMVKRFTSEMQDNDITGLTEGGKYIGWLERILVMLLMLINQPSGIGFLIAAKSILRFGEIKDASQRKIAEYVIIGTFLSFGWALLVSILTQKAVKYWMP